ncbi:MAG TPA: hypothetical protein VHL11_11775, partial [Phototrophicaceae bacterium]|nr:hypothetical protein [Phototrophicaceae bacterium]
MKLNLNTLKVLLALVIIIGALFWSGDSIRNRSYVGTDLNFPVGQGVVTVTNPSTESIPVQ